VKAGSENVSVDEGENQDKDFMDASDNLGLVPEANKIGGEFSHGGGIIPPPSPLGDFFDAEDFIKSTFMLKGNLERFESMEVREIQKLVRRRESDVELLLVYSPRERC
jgi:hypothetical protein